MTATMLVNEYIHQLTELGNALQKLHQFTSDLDETSAPLLVRDIRDETLGILGWHVSCLEAAGKVLMALENQNDLEKARYFLGHCNQYYSKMFGEFYETLFVAHQIVALEKLGGKRKDKRWANTTLKDLYACHASIHKVCSTLLDSWKIIADTLAAKAPMMHSTSIGQQFMFPEPK